MRSLLLAAILFSSLAAEDGVEIKQFLSFESKELSGAHDDSGWAGGSARLRIADSGDPRRGHWLEADISSFGQIAFPALAMKPGASYRVSAMIAARGIQTVTISLRQASEPYNSHGDSEQQVFETPKPVSFVVRAVKNANPSRVQISIHGYTTLFIDDVKVEELNGAIPDEQADPLALIQAEPPPTSVNRLANAGFEVGTDGWFTKGRAQIVTENAAEGTHCLRLPAKGSLCSPWLRIPLRYDTWFAVQARSMTGKATVNLTVSDFRDFRNGSDGKQHRITIDALQGWVPVGFRWRPRIPIGQISPTRDFYLLIQSDQEVLLDAVEVRSLAPGLPDERAPFSPRSRDEFSLDVDAPMHVAMEGSPASITLRASRKGASAHVRALDETGAVFHDFGTIDCPDGLAHFQARLPSGAWRLTTADSASAAHDHIEAPARIDAETLLLIVPPMPDVPRSVWHFGTHIRDDAEMRAAAALLGWRWNRLHDTSRCTKWAAVEPKEGVFSFDRAGIERLRDGDWSLLGNLEDLPDWLAKRFAMKNGGIRAYPKEMEPAWRNFCSRMADAAHGLVDEWEVTNEPNLRNLPTEDYLRLLHDAHTAIKDRDPSARVVGLGGAAPVDSPWVTSLIAAGIGRYCDAVSIHAYGSLLAANRGPEAMQGWVGRLRTSLDKAGTPGLAIYDSESGLVIRASLTKHRQILGDANPRDAANALPKVVASVLASGLDRWYWYAGFDETNAGQGSAYCITEIGHVMMAPFQPMAVAISTLEGLAYEGRQAAPPDIVHLQFAGRGSRVHVFWCVAGTATVDMPPGATLVNQWGRTQTPTAKMALGQEVVYAISAMP